MAVLSTKFRGFAPDARGSNYPLELVFEVDAPPSTAARRRPSWAAKLLTLASIAALAHGILSAIAETVAAFTG